MADTVKSEAMKLIRKLPKNSTWDDVMHEMYVRQAIEDGLKDSKAGRIKNVDEVRKKYGLDS
jgi:predicted transcriptional regulator